MEPALLVNRSDGELFHVMLFAGPYARAKFSGGYYDERLVCQFAYAHVKFGTKERTVTVVMSNAYKDAEGILNQVESAADKLADLFELGERLTAVYTFNGRELRPGFPI
jgi:hypothetical protein